MCVIQTYDNLYSKYYTSIPLVIKEKKFIEKYGNWVEFGHQSPNMNPSQITWWFKSRLEPTQTWTRSTGINFLLLFVVRPCGFRFDVRPGLSFTLAVCIEPATLWFQQWEPFSCTMDYYLDLGTLSNPCTGSGSSNYVRCRTLKKSVFLVEEPSSV